MSELSSTQTGTAGFWQTAVDGIAWFVANTGPAVLFALLTLAVAISFALYYWAVTAPRRHSLEWIAMLETQPRLTLTLPHHPLTRQDILPMLLLTLVYAATAFFRLGDTAVPQSYRVFSETDEQVTFSYGDVIQVDKISYYTALGDGSYTLEYSTDGVHWNRLPLSQSYSSLFKWEVVDLTLPTTDEYGNTQEATGPIRASMFRLSPSQIYREEGLWLAELVLWKGGTPHVPLQVSEGDEVLFDEREQWADRYTYLNSTYFDEIYHARTALEHLKNIPPYEVSHPPLGKLILSLGIVLFGMNPFGWRFMGTLFGVLMVPLLYLFLKNLFGKPLVALCGSALFTFDFMHLVQTRIATIDTYGVFFLLLSYYFLYRWLALPPGTRLRTTALPLLLSGLSWGLGCAAKWTVVYGGLGLALLWLLGLMFQHRAWPRPVEHSMEPAALPAPSFPLHVLGTILLSVVFFVALPAGIYLASYIPYATAQAAETGFTLSQLWDIMWDNQVFMLTYHADVHTPHPYQSDWYQWIVDGRPILYYRDLDYANTEGIKSLFASFNNPLVSWTGLLAAAALVAEVIRRRCGKALFLLISILSQFLPWLFIGRILFAYHYFPTVLFLCMAIAYLMDRIIERNQKGWLLAVGGFTGWAVLLYFLFYPALTGLYMPTWYATYVLRWFPSWPL